MGCLNTKEKYNVNKEERGLKTHRKPGSQHRFSENSGYRETLSRPGSHQNITVTLDREIVKKTEGSGANTNRNNTGLVNASVNGNSSDQNSGKSSGLSSRNQFDRASQLRRSKKKRRKSEDNLLTPRKDQTLENSSVSTPTTALEIVKQETAAHNLTSHSIGSRAEYNSAYGNLI